MDRPLYSILLACALPFSLFPTVCAEPPALESEVASKLAGLALDCLHREYPNKISHVMQSDEDVAPPRQLSPAFFGCFDWHSAVHGHWLLVRLAREFPKAPFAESAVEALEASLTPEHIRAEVRYLKSEGRASFERPYGLAWLLQLATELREWDDPRARRWSRNLRPLEAAASERIQDWLPNLNYPIRTGEHSQTAFAIGLMLDWSRVSGDREMERLLLQKIGEHYVEDRDCPLHYEPSGQDFLSPCLAEADLLRRVLGNAAFAAWLGGFLPDIPQCLELGARSSGCTQDWLKPAEVLDRSDPKLAHLDGLNLSRAWMLRGIAGGLPHDDPRTEAIERSAELHRRAGLESVTGEHYVGGHWLGSFATYLVTERGRSGDR